MKCFQCESDNPKQSFCGACGAPLHLEAFIARQVKVEVGHHTQNRDLVEADSAARIFGKVFGWVKMCAGAFAIILLPLAAVGIYKGADLFSAINSAKKSVSNSAASAQQDVVKTADKERKAIEIASTAAQISLKEIRSTTIREGRAAVDTAIGAKVQIARQTALVQTEIDGLHKQIETADELQPEMVSMREELTRQRQVLSSSQDLARSIFSSHQVEFFQPDQAPLEHYKVLPRLKGNGATVYLLLNKVPIAQTLQLQFHIYSQPNNSYVTIHNLVIFSWGDPPDVLKSHQLAASYFPDPADGDLIRVLSEKDGRIYADGEPLFRFGEADPGFHGDKWIQTQ